MEKWIEEDDDDGIRSRRRRTMTEVGQRGGG